MKKSPFSRFSVHRVKCFVFLSPSAQASLYETERFLTLLAARQFVTGREMA